MRILKYKSDQYAGVRNREVSFAGGMNVILGDNETGKSTMITGIYETLLRSSKTKWSSKEGQALKEQSFPTSGGNVIDGKVWLEIGKEEFCEEFCIEKKWTQDKTGSVTALINNSLNERYMGVEAEERIGKLLNYGEAIYNHIVFGRQNNEVAILDWFYSFIDTEKTQGDGIAEAREKISEALSAAGGISEDLYLQKLREKMNLLGSHWDFSLDAPEKGRGIGNPWKKGVGEILEAYYALEEQKRILRDERNLVDSITEDEKALQEKKRRKAELEEQLQEMNQLKSAVEKKELLSDQKNGCEQKLRRFRAAEKELPKLETDRENIEKLSGEEEEEKNRARKLELEKRLEKFYGLEKRRKEYWSAMSGMENIEEDSRTVRNLSDEIDGLQLKLGSAKLHAQIIMLSERAAQIMTADGEMVLNDKQYNASINGFAKIRIPGIAEIMIAPQELDVTGVQGQITGKRVKIQKIFEKYQITDKEELDQKCESYRENRQRLFELDGEIRKLLSGKNAEALEEELRGIQIDETVFIRENLADKIQTVLSRCGAKTLDGCRTATQVRLEACKEEYGSVADLKAAIAEEERKLAEAEKALKELASVSWTKEDFDRETEGIQKELKGRDERSGLNFEIEDLIAGLARKNRDIDDIDFDAREREVNDLEKELEQKKRLYHQYNRIKEDFEALREKQGSRNEAFYGRFNKYLSIITGEQVQIENGKIRSNRNELSSKELLSRGTKQTVLLAFRLALLEYYYQNEGGVIILDDVLLDMDPERRRQSVKLLQKFAEKNQVIFATCDPVVADMLGGNQIEWKCQVID